jgi:SAM-dependent methyltransferase
MFAYAVRRAFDIVGKHPAKALKALTPTGWRRFRSLMKERRPDSPEMLAAHAAKMAANRTEFESDAWRHDGPLSVRRYATYDDYLEHQREKLDSLGGVAYKNPDKAVQMFRRRFELIGAMPRSASVICLGARRGEEVRAFIELGHFALGIDLNPGPDAEYVVVGDFHGLNFADGSVDCVYTNCLDHALEIDKILAEVRRVLKPDGMFIIDIIYGYEEGYSTGNHDTMHWTTARHFSDHLAGVGDFTVLSFRDLEKHGSKFWTQSIMRKA